MGRIGHTGGEFERVVGMVGWGGAWDGRRAGESMGWVWSARPSAATASAHGGRDVGRQGRGRIAHGTASGRGGAAGADCGQAIRGGAYPNRPPPNPILADLCLCGCRAPRPQDSKKREVGEYRN